MEFAQVLKANPYRDEHGRFSSKDKASSQTSEADSGSFQELLHGTDGATVERILAEGFKASTSGAYGQGVYLINSIEGAKMFGSKVVKVTLPKGKIKVFETPEDYSLLKEDEAIKVSASEHEKAGLTPRRAMSQAIADHLTKEGYVGHSSPVGGFVYTIILDPAKLVKNSLAEKADTTLYLAEVLVGHQVLKANPYHDETGRFTTQGNAKFVSVGGKFSTSQAKARIDEAARKISIGGFREDARMSKLGFTVMSDTDQAKHPELRYAYFSKAKTSKLGNIDLPSKVIQGDVSRTKAKELVSSTRKVPPIKVARIDGELVVVDGHHRLAAAKARGDKKIDAELISPSKKSAFTY